MDADYRATKRQKVTMQIFELKTLPSIVIYMLKVITSRCHVIASRCI